MEVPTSAPPSRRRTAAGRRAQRKRAEGRVAMLGAALSQALKELEAPAPVSRSDAAERAPASSTDAAECVMQVDEVTGLDAQRASSVAWAATGTCSPKRLGRSCLLSRCRREWWCVSSVSRSGGS